MQQLPLVRALSLAFPLACALPVSAQADEGDSPPVKSLGLIVVTGTQPTSLPTQISTTIEGIKGAEIAEKINATDAEDALRYFPSLLVRKRYIGDYNHAVLSSRASGTGNSARSMVYADGILLSNYLGNGATFTPRWGLVTPEEIERVDVLYGPFSAAYPGNSAGAVVDYVTRMPRQFEAHAQVGYFTQPFSLYGTEATASGQQASASLGSRDGAFSWWFNLNRTDSTGQPLTFPTRLVSSGTTPTAAAPGTAVTGAVLDQDKSGNPWYLLGTATRYHTIQDHAKLKLAYDFDPTVRAAYTLGVWNNQATSQSESFLRDASGQPFYAGTANIGGRNYTIAATDFGQSREQLEHVMHGLSVKSRTRGVFDWEVAVSLYDYRKDLQRTPTVARPAADLGGAGRLTDLGGTGWDTLTLKGVWRPEGVDGEHIVDFGVQQDRYRWRQLVSNTGDWIGGDATSPFTDFGGRTQLRSAYAQDAWTLSSQWKTVLGLRAEQWRAFEGYKVASGGQRVVYADRRETWLSPKAAVGYQAAADWTLKLASGRAVRMPTVGELFQGGLSSSGTYVASDPVTNPDLRPEKSWTTELSSEWDHGTHQWRTTLFHELTKDALYSQSAVVDGKTVTSTQNIDRMRTVGLELACRGQDVGWRGIDLNASATWTRSRILDNAGYVSTPGDTIGKQQPRVPMWRGSLLVTWRATPQLSVSYGARAASNQYGTLNNSDPNGFTYQGFSKFFTTDLRLRYRFDRQWSAAFGIDNLNNYQYWNFHPYPQRTYSADLKFDL
ncbi:TonB-dependent receptor [Sphaerotilus uruguayifluvii]|uniref:Iron complex outermembrane receptor protein n=1 Tax=Sphaerotilus uruguayifluvii TaxID=2735897 RepID=A0ABX2G2R7_9BURK|nr:TonB-dependent receptor [Leptothrix sp. C29]NRT55700.1 iron complex outermembrane receptor protein [Leptothrix sp. C29]